MLALTKALQSSLHLLSNTLFSGMQRKSDILPGTSAIESQGICCYYKILLRPSSDARLCARIGVIPGSVESADKRYSGIIDLDHRPFRDTTQLKKYNDNRPTYCVAKEAKKLANDYNGGIFKPVANEYVGDLVGNELVPWLQLGLEVPVIDGRSFEYIGPAKALENVVRGTGLTSCNQTQCNAMPQIADMIGKLVPKGCPVTPYEQFKYGESEVFIFRGDTSTALIAAWGCYLPLFLTDSNCLACAVGVGIRNSWQNYAIVCSEESFKQVSVCEAQVEEYLTDN